MCAECLSDFLLNTHWNVTHITMSIFCPMQSYLHSPSLCKRPTCWASLWATCDWMLQTLQSHLAAQCSPTYLTLPYVHNMTRPTCRVSLWRLTHKAKLSSHRLGCHTRLSSGFPIFCLSMLSAKFLFFCCCLSVQKLDLSTWSLMWTLCAWTISVCLLWLNFLGNLWA